MIIKTTERDFLNYKIGKNHPFFLIAGPCVIESRDLVFQIAEHLRAIQERINILILFKASFDKANRSSSSSFRGPGLEKGLKILAEIKKEFNLPIVTDIHEPAQAKPVGEVADMIQIPAFLCRQSDLIREAALNAAFVNIKKGQFIAPKDAELIVEKVVASGKDFCFLTERGYTFGYNNLVVDPRSFEIIRAMDIPLIFDATHSVQMPGGGKTSGGARELIAVQARAAVASGVEGLFFEVHPEPEKGLSDASNMFPLDQLEQMINNLLQIDTVVKGR